MSLRPYLGYDLGYARAIERNLLGDRQEIAAWDAASITHARARSGEAQATRERAEAWIPGDAARAAQINGALQTCAERTAAALGLKASVVQLAGNLCTRGYDGRGGTTVSRPFRSAWCDVPVAAVEESSDPAQLVLGLAQELLDDIKREHGPGIVWFGSGNAVPGVRTIMHLVHDDGRYIVPSTRGDIFRLRVFYVHQSMGATEAEDLLRARVDGCRRGVAASLQPVPMGRALAADLTAAWSRNEAVRCCLVDSAGDRACEAIAKPGAAYCDRHRGDAGYQPFVVNDGPLRATRPARSVRVPDPGERCVDGVRLATLIEIDEDRRREGPGARVQLLKPETQFSPAQRAAVAAHWSAELRKRVAASKVRDAERAVSIRCEIDEL